ncbi:hypothetical protein EJB05_03847, partial [Eragrostis curvula]
MSLDMGSHLPVDDVVRKTPRLRSSSPNPCAATSPRSPLPGSDGSGSWSSAPPRSSPALKLDPAFLTPAPTATSTTQEVAAPDPAAGGNSQSSSSSTDCLPTPEIQLEIAIEVVYRLDMAEERRSLSLQEQSLREFLLDQIANLQEAVGAHDDEIPPDQEFSPDDHEDAIVVESSAAAVGSLQGRESSATSTTQEVTTPDPAAGGNSQSSSSSSDCLLTPEIQLEIAIEVVYRLDMAEETRSLSLQEQSLREFLLDQIANLQEVVGAHDDKIPPDREFFPDDHEDAMVVESSGCLGWGVEQLHPPGSIGQAISSRAPAAARAEPEATSVLSSFGQERIIENDNMLHLPTDIIQKILFNITDPASLACLASTCKFLGNLIKDPSFLDCLRLRRHDHGFVPSLLLGFFNQERTKSPPHSLQRETDKWHCLAPGFMPTCLHCCSMEAKDAAVP